MSAEPAGERITFYGLAKAAYEDAGGDYARAEETLLRQIERNDPPYVALRHQLLLPAIRDRLHVVAIKERNRAWNSDGGSRVRDTPMPEPLIEDCAPEGGEPPRPLHVIESAPDPPTIVAPQPKAEWRPNAALAERMETYARKTMLDYPVGRMGPLGNLTINQVRDAIVMARTQRRDSTVMEAFFGLVAKDRPGYRKVRELYTAEQLDDLKRQAVIIAGNVRLQP